jgi:hypothetical protein
VTVRIKVNIPNYSHYHMAIVVVCSPTKDCTFTASTKEKDEDEKTPGFY